MAKYYFLTNLLPSIAIGEKPDLSFKELKDLCQLNLTGADWEMVNQLIWSIDLSNIRAFWLGMALDERGNFSPKELEEALLVQEGLPEYLIDYLHRYETTADRLRFFPALHAAFYQDASTRLKSGFLKNYFTTEREIRLILTALRAKISGRDVLRELQFEDPNDSLVKDIISQKDAADYIPPAEYESLKVIYLRDRSDPKQLQRSILEYRFKIVEETEENEYFSIEKILGYLIRLMIVEEWASLDEEKGHELMEDLSGRTYG